MSDDIRHRLEQAQHERDDALERAAHKDADVETLGKAVQRLLAIIERLRKGQPTDAERRLISTLQADVKQLRARRDAARKAREDAQSKAQRLAQLIRRLQDRLERGKFTLEDSVTPPAISRDVKGAAGYVDGIYHTWPEIADGPWPVKVSICVLASGEAMVADVEPGDLTNAEAAGWAHGRQAHGHRPNVYTNLANAQPLVNALAGVGLERNEFGLWVAHDTGKAHICGPACGYGLKTRADATQWGLDGHGTGRNVDINLVRGSFVN